MNCSRQCRQTRFLSTMWFGRLTRWRWNWGCYNFLLFVFGVNVCFVLSFIIFHLWVNSHILSTFTVRLGILGHSKFHVWDDVMSSVDWPEIITDQFGNYDVISGQSNTETNSSRYGFIRIWFQISHYRSLKKYMNFIHLQGAANYLVVQAGLLTPLTFARWQWTCEFYTANFKDIFGGPYSEECIWQQAITCCLCYNYKMPQNTFFQWTYNLLVSRKMMQLFFHPPSPFASNFCNCNSGVICTVSQF